MSSFKLRDYQVEAIQSVKGHYESGIKHQLVVMATGLGKTACMSHAHEFLGLKGKVLWLAHRDFLLDHARQSMLQIDPNLRVEIEQAGRTASPDSDIVVASVQTIGRANSSRIRKFDPNDFDCIITDEAHHLHQSNSTYQNVLDYFQVQDKLHIGLTATPQRGSGEGLGKFFDIVAYKKDLRDGIEEGWLAPITAYSIRAETDLDDVPIRYGDFQEKSLAETINTDQRNELTVKAYKAKAEGSKAIVFCANVEHAEKLCAMFNDYGYEARCIFGHTEKRERAANMEWLNKTEGAICVNVAVFGEGVDCPTLETAVMARPTHSSLFYTQAIGRITRKSPGKERGIVIDICDNSSRVSIQTTASLFSLPEKLDVGGKDVLSVAREFEKITEEAPELDYGECYTLDDVKKIIKLTNLFDHPDNEATRLSSMCWSKRGKVYFISLGTWPNHQYILIEQNLVDKWELNHLNVSRRNRKRKRKIAEHDTLEDCVREAELWMRRNCYSEMIYLDKNARWRRKPPSQKQLEVLQRLAKQNDNIREALESTPALNRGMASALIGAALSKID